MLSYRVTVLGRFLQALEPERAARFRDQLRSYEASAGAARDPQLGNFEVLMTVTAETEPLARSLARAVVASSLYDVGFSVETAPIDSVDTSTPSG